MATNFPTSLDDGTSIPNPTGVNTQNNPDHASLHGNTGDGLKAVETKLGIGASTPVVSRLLFGTGTGTSAWTQLTSAQLAATLSDETGTGSAVFATTPTLVTPKVDTINEATGSNGTTIGGVNIRSGALNTNNSVVTANITNLAVTSAKLSGIDKSLLTIDSNPYKFRVSRNAAANTGSSAFAKIVFDTEQYDTNSNFATGTYTCPVAGFYHFDSVLQTAVNSNDVIASLFKNGAEYSRGTRLKNNAAVSGVSVSDTIQCAASDTIEVWAFGAPNALDLTAAINNYFSGFLISRT